MQDATASKTESATLGPWKYAASAGKHIWRSNGDERNTGYVRIAQHVHIPGDGYLIAAAPEMFEVLQAMVDAEVEYMTINHLGDPEKQHNVKWARAVLAKAGRT